MKKIYIYTLITVVIISGMIIYSTKNNQKPIVVKTAVAKVGDINAYLSTTGTVKSKTSKDYYGIQGKIKNTNKKVGDRVKKGDILVEYDVQDLATPVKQAQLQYENSILQRNDIQNQNKNIKNKISDLDNQINALEGSKSATDKVKLDAIKQQRSALSPITEEKLKQAENSVNLAKLAVDAAKQKLSENQTNIICDIDGVVTTVNAVQGAMGSGVQPVVTVQDIENLKVIAALGKYDVNKIVLGQEVNVKSGNSSYKGKVSAIEPIGKKSEVPTSTDTTLTVDIDIIEKAPELKINFGADVDIKTGEVKNIIKVPSESLKLEKGNKNLIYTFDGKTVHERTVKIGMQSDTEVEIKEGIKNGEKVILNPSTVIKEGIAVKESVEESKK